MAVRHNGPDVIHGSEKLSRWFLGAGGLSQGIQGSLIIWIFQFYPQHLLLVTLETGWWVGKTSALTQCNCSYTLMKLNLL